MRSREQLVSSIKQEPNGLDLALSGRLAELAWVKTSRKPPPSEKAAQSSDIIYNVETAEDIGKAFRRGASRK
jgi:hypothetical protein